MPHISTAMHRSVRRGVGDIVLDSLLGGRDVVSEADSIKNTFSSWDNCMAKTYCKYASLNPLVTALLTRLADILSLLA